jgi:hypothetical protein
MMGTLVLGAILLGIIFYIYGAVRLSKRRNFIRHYRFPPGLLQKLQRTHPHIQAKEYSLVAQSLRQFFLAYLVSGKQNVAMPSRVADDMWHEFILYTHQYAEFCRLAFGGFFHHTPAAAMGAHRESNVGLRRIWWHTCKEENIAPRAPLRMPLLFALDSKLNIAHGHRYTLASMAVLGAQQAEEIASAASGCGGSSNSVSIFSDKGVDGDTSGFGDSSSDSGGSSDGGSSCGGGGCGGD